MLSKDTICLAVAGNFAHHLQQAGELKEFAQVKTKEEKAPKGIFPFYLPNSKTFLGTYPISQDILALPSYKADVQLEPEIAILFDIVYDEDKKVIDLIAKKFTTFNDTTIRKDGVAKISLKKSWGENSKGIGDKWIDIDKFEVGGVMDNYHLASFVKRDGVVHSYGVDAPLLGYSYFYTKLVDWLIDKINNQKDFSILEDIYSYIKEANYPSQAFISIGATAYSDFGEHNFLQSKDEIFVIAYDKRVDDNSFISGENKIILHQKVM